VWARQELCRWIHCNSFKTKKGSILLLIVIVQWEKETRQRLRRGGGLRAEFQYAVSGLSSGYPMAADFDEVGLDDPRLGLDLAGLATMLPKMPRRFSSV
jgi:hypothetical protein